MASASARCSRWCPLLAGHAMQRIARDVRAVCQHAAYNLHINLEAYGRVMLGLSPNLPFV